MLIYLLGGDVMWLWLPLVIGAAVDLLTATDCPSRGRVAAELTRLGSSPSGASRADRDQPRLSAEIRWVGENLSIMLRNPQGTVAAERTLPRAGSCIDLAAASAVVIAAWQEEMRADLGPALAPPQEGEGTSPPRQAQQAPPRSLPLPLPGPALDATARSTAGPVPDGGRPWELGVGVLASRESDFAPGLMIGAQMGRPQSQLAGRMEVTATGSHALALGPNPGQSLWSRVAFDLGVRRRLWLGKGDGALDLHVDVAAAVIRLAGSGFGANYTRSGLDFGVGAGVRWAWTAERLAPFVALDGWGWPGSKVVTADGTQAQGRLPQFELRAAVGVSFGRFR